MMGLIRKATIKDIAVVHQLLQHYGQIGELLPRPLSELYDHVRDFTVYEDDRIKQVVGCCALQFCWEDLAEIRSLAVHPEHVGKGIGRKLADAVLSEALGYDIKQVFTLTYRPEFFDRLDFHRIDRSELPIKIWSGCITCVKYPDCDEIAMMKPLAG
jgi:amino-acid N-acetyltransferase